jgi:hypothetical protein
MHGCANDCEPDSGLGHGIDPHYYRAFLMDVNAHSGLSSIALHRVYGTCNKGTGLSLAPDQSLVSLLSLCARFVEGSMAATLWMTQGIPIYLLPMTVCHGCTQKSRLPPSLQT